MRKGTDIIGKAVVAYDSGEKFETVLDLIFDQNSNRLLGFLVDEAGWFSSSKVIALQSVQAIGPDAIIVPSKSAEVPASEIQPIDRVLEHNNIMKGTKIVSTDGRNLGTMIDLYFDEVTGDIEGYEVSGGIFADAYSGRSFVPAPETLKIGKDVAFVPAETADMMQEQVGGIKAAMQTAGEKIRETADATGEKLQAAGASATRTVTNAIVDPQAQKDFALGKIATTTVENPAGETIVLAGQQITPSAIAVAERDGMLDKLYRAAGGSLSEPLGERASTTAAGIGDRLNTTAAGLAIEGAQGRRVARAVYTPDGFIVAAAGQIVTPQVIDRAKTYHQESALLEAVGLSTGDAVKGTASATGQQLKEKTLDATEQIRTGAKGLWEQVKETTSDLQERSTQAVEEKRIKGALGRAVVRVIFGTNDEVILNIGDPITHQSIATARQAGVLDILLDSVYTETPHLSLDDLRAPEPPTKPPLAQAPGTPTPPQLILDDRQMPDSNSTNHLIN
jgi:uncharacterized protein YrrD